MFRSFKHKKRKVSIVHGILVPFDGAQWTIGYSKQLPNNVHVDEAIKTKYLAQGHKHVGTSGARTHGLAPLSPALFNLPHTL